ncbi:hypothetical protein N657DRAFT_310350 [Parathielavia appendiculata]|uniref:Uncharacterized protein n=1 Tax=Parathielavia appendiculata TaxID=2587402 RepID=A0AAN6U609_9PEZI|nr:hypothetical protein N657DRAFT_310350 [Parathielavia appendiculata]
MLECALLAGANACAKLELADEIVATLGNDLEVIAGAAALVAAEKNSNTFANIIPAIRSNAALPVTPGALGYPPCCRPRTGRGRYAERQFSSVSGHSSCRWRSQCC